MATSLPHRAEAAIRVWSTIDPEVERLQKLVDDERQGILHGVLEELIGFEQSRDRDPDLLRWSLDEFFRAALESR